MEKRSFAGADRKHLHHRLLDSGLTVKQAVMFLYAITVVFGIMVYYLQDYGISLLGLFFLSLVVFMLIFAYIYKKTKKREDNLTEGIK